MFNKEGCNMCHFTDIIIYGHWAFDSYITFLKKRPVFLIKIKNRHRKVFALFYLIKMWIDSRCCKSVMINNKINTIKWYCPRQRQYVFLQLRVFAIDAEGTIFLYYFYLLFFVYHHRTHRDLLLKLLYLPSEKYPPIPCYH